MGDDRRGDWEKGVDENLAMLNSTQRSTDKELDEHDIEIAKHDRIILGDPENGKIGISAQIDSLDNLVNELRAEYRSIKATLYGDHTGHAGIESRVDRLEDKKEIAARRAEKREGYFWHFVTAVSLQILFLAGVVVLNWDRIEDFYVKHLKRAPAHAIAPAKPRRPKKHKEQKPIVMPELGGDSTSQEMH